MKKNFRVLSILLCFIIFTTGCHRKTDDSSKNEDSDLEIAISACTDLEETDTSAKQNEHWVTKVGQDDTCVGVLPNCRVVFQMNPGTLKNKLQKIFYYSSELKDFGLQLENNSFFYPSEIPKINNNSIYLCCVSPLGEKITGFDRELFGFTTKEPVFILKDGNIFVENEYDEKLIVQISETGYPMLISV